MSWRREQSTEKSIPKSNRNHLVGFEYDSADIPFSPPTRNTGYLESGLPFWKSNITNPDKYTFPSSDQTCSASDQTISPLLKFSSSTRSNESLALNSGQNRPLISQSLPATPLSTPAPTPLTTPVTTPHPSPLLNRKNSDDMEVVCKVTSRVNQDQLSSNAKWFYLGFRSVQPPSSGAMEVSNHGDDFLKESQLTSNSTNNSEFRPLSYLQKRALAISNRDLNFLAPTSM